MLTATFLYWLFLILTVIISPVENTTEIASGFAYCAQFRLVVGKKTIVVVFDSTVE